MSGASSAGDIIPEVLPEEHGVGCRLWEGTIPQQEGPARAGGVAGPAGATQCCQLPGAGSPSRGQNPAGLRGAAQA